VNPVRIKPNLVDQTCELVKWLCSYRKLHDTTTREQFWQYFLLLLTKSELRCGQTEFEGRRVLDRVLRMWDRSPSTLVKVWYHEWIYKYCHTFVYYLPWPKPNLCCRNLSMSIQMHDHHKKSMSSMIDWLSSVLRPRQYSIGYLGDGFTSQKTQPTVSKCWSNKKYTNN